MLTAAQIEAFREHGYFNLGRVFDEDALARIRTEYDRLLRRPVRLGEKGKGKFDFSPLLHVQSDVMRGFATSPELVAPAVDLLGPDVRLYWDQAVSKPPGATSDVPWHQDNGYGAVEPAEYVTCTIAIDATTQENGCLWIQPGSHRRGPVAHRKTDFFFYVGYDGDERGVPMEAEAGDVLVFSSLTMHRSGPNVSQRPRRSWVIQFCAAEACFGPEREPLDDRLLVARGGRVLDEPARERPLDLAKLLSTQD
jgi:ectoine hydroxylase-related dioxygenase (phytanoyl-CoA dioxygenase family)